MQIQVSVPSHRQTFEAVARATTAVLTNHAIDLDKASVNIDGTHPKFTIYPNSNLEELLAKYDEQIPRDLTTIRIDEVTDFDEALNIATHIAKRLNTHIHLVLNHNPIQITENTSIDDVYSTIIKYQRTKVSGGDFVLKGFGNLISLSHTAVALANHYSRPVSFNWYLDDDERPTSILLRATPGQDVKTILDRFEKAWEDRHDEPYRNIIDISPNTLPKRFSLELPAIERLAFEGLSVAIETARTYNSFEVEANIDTAGHTFPITLDTEYNEIIERYRKLIPHDLLEVTFNEEFDFALSAQLTLELSQQLNKHLLLRFNYLELEVNPDDTYEKIRAKFFEKLILDTKKDGDNTYSEVTIGTGSADSRAALAIAINRLIDSPVAFKVMAEDGSGKISRIIVDKNTTSHDLALQIHVALGKIQ